jgi:hypothetical protein
LVLFGNCTHSKLLLELAGTIIGVLSKSHTPESSVATLLTAIVAAIGELFKGPNDSASKAGPDPVDSTISAC